MAKKRSVERLDESTPEAKRAGAGLGTTLDRLVTVVNQVRLLLSNLVLDSAGLATATTTSKVKTAAVIAYLIDGVFKSLGISDNFWTLSGINVADGFTQKYLLLVDGAGAASVLEGTAAKSAGEVALPALPESKALVGLLQVANASGAAFVPGTTALNAAGVTATFVNGFDAARTVAGAITALT